MTKLYSQLDDEIFITKYFNGYTGRFLDLGALDGIAYSNTYRLAMGGWSGVSLEPSSAWDNLMMNMKHYNVECLKIGIGVRDEEVDFWDGGGNAVSSILDSHKEMWEKAGAKFNKIKITTVTWDTLLDRVGTDFDLINLDIEGNSVDIFKLLPYNRLPKLKMIIVEHDNRQAEVVLPGFKLYHKNDLNVLLVRK